tara:strand:+ start:265 stop:1020 length:756 start_codon:yes stop_codon:yes gene_type:complete
MSCIFGRVGNKYYIRKQVLENIPKEFKLYIEPFVGSGAIYLNMNLQNHQSIINDIDKELIDNWKIVKEGLDIDENTYKYPIQDKDLQTQYYKSPSESNEEIFIKYIISSLGSFGSKSIGKIYKPISESNFKKKIIRAKQVKDYMTNTEVLNECYKKVLDKYDDIDSFFYLDPPYENSRDLYKNSKINYIELKEILQNLKGKFLLSINDSLEIREIFKEFNIIPIQVKGRGGAIADIGKGIRNELFITNYKK